MCLLVLISSFSSSLIYLFIVCLCCSILLMCVVTGIFDSWFAILVSYLFFGGFMCVLAYFSSFSFSSVQPSNPSMVLTGLMTCSGIVLTSKRFHYSSLNEFGASWDSMQLLSLLSITMLLVVMYSVIAVGKEGWGGVRVFSL